jgi:hypothetical protein
MFKKLMFSKYRQNDEPEGHFNFPIIASSLPSASPIASPFPFFIDESNPLCELGEVYAPTKRNHNYLPYYWMHFRDVRYKVRTFCEIGVQTDKSLRMWEEFFPNATIYGIDIDPNCRKFEGGRRRIMIGDQSDAEFLADVIRRIGTGLDVVIDDGSHRPAHQVASFDILFPQLSDHGIYAIEDTGGCVGDNGLQTVNAFKRIIDHIMFWPKELDPADWPSLTDFPSYASWADRNLIGVAFYRWLVFAFRGLNPGDNKYLRR